MKKLNTMVKTFTQNDKNINNYIRDWNSLFVENSTLFGIHLYKLKLIEINTFFINPLILQNFTKSQLTDLTEQLLTLYPFGNNKNFLNMIFKSMFSETDNIIGVCDYSLIEFNNYYICFHNHLTDGVTISSIYRKSEIKHYIKKDFSYKIQ